MSLLVWIWIVTGTISALLIGITFFYIYNSLCAEENIIKALKNDKDVERVQELADIAIGAVYVIIEKNTNSLPKKQQGTIRTYLENREFLTKLLSFVERATNSRESNVDTKKIGM